MPRTSFPLDTRIAGWLVAAGYLAHSLMTVFLARSDRFGPLRESYRGGHYLLGTIVLLLVLWRLWLWRRDKSVAPAPGVPAGLHHWARWLALVAYCVIVVAPVLGIF